jgi:hypothetical protein
LIRRESERLDVDVKILPISEIYGEEHGEEHEWGQSLDAHAI